MYHFVLCPCVGGYFSDCEKGEKNQRMSNLEERQRKERRKDERERGKNKAREDKRMT